jgi:tryptophan synthase alpha chain
MTRIKDVFSRLETRGECGLITYVMAGDPHPSYTIEIIQALIDGGSDIIELGIPFSDPIADGPTIQAASQRALNAGTTPSKVLQICKEAKETSDTPIVILSYANPIFRMGFKKFFTIAKNHQVDGVIIPDLPIEESQEYRELGRSLEIDTIFLATPLTTENRMQEIIDYTSGFLYLVSIEGVTGAREHIRKDTLSFIRKAATIANQRIPLAVGFGISKPKQIHLCMQNGANAVIVGSAFVRIIEKQISEKEKMLKSLTEYTEKLKSATKYPKNAKNIHLHII